VIRKKTIPDPGVKKAPDSGSVFQGFDPAFFKEKRGKPSLVAFKIASLIHSYPTFGNI
jgi:hypothetical protein